MSDIVLIALIGAVPGLLIGIGPALKWWLERRDARRAEAIAKAEADKTVAAQALTIATKDTELAAKDRELATKDRRIEFLEGLLAQRLGGPA